MAANTPQEGRGEHDEVTLLVVPFARPLSSERAYYLAYPADPLASPAVAQFRAWMLAQVG